jgi:hypothetical protein
MSAGSPVWSQTGTEAAEFLNFMFAVSLICRLSAGRIRDSSSSAANEESDRSPVRLPRPIIHEEKVKAGCRA